jgi:YhcH/YjgK/YiaL family protein
MILAPLSEFGTYLKLHPLFDRVEQALITLDFSKPGEKIYIDGENLIAIPSFNKARNASEAPLESHDRYIDIQICLQGDETMGWRDRQTCNAIKEPYNSDNDITFYSDQPTCFVTLKPNQFAIFYPSDCHAPLIGEGFIKKVVFKVKIDF